MSDDEDFSTGDDEYDEPYSGSEDEWHPDNTKKSESDEDDDDDDDEHFEEVPPPSKKKKSMNVSLAVAKSKKGKYLKMSSLRSKMHKKYNPPPKTFSPSICPKKQNETAPSDSGSSGDECLVDPEKLDLKSSFFDVKPSTSFSRKDEPPVFDCNGGMNLTDSDENDSDLEDVEPIEKTTNCFKNFFEFNEAVENVKDKIKTLDAKPIVEQKFDVSSLLAMGESSKPHAKKRKLIKKEEHSDSDWEEVEANEKPLLTAANKEEILQVTIALPQHQRREKKITDEQASLMRQLNRVIKENHVMFHKASLLCHIAHGIYCNKALNNPSLMKAALQLLPSKKCYPEGRTEFKYFESISKWFQTAINLKDNIMYAPLDKLPPLPISLAIQIKLKQATCKRDYILIFIVLLRAMGIQCRLVMNLVPLPLRPAQTDLCTIKLKKPNNTENPKTAANTKEEVKIKKEKSSKTVKEPSAKKTKRLDDSPPRKSVTVKKENTPVFSPRKTRTRSEKSKESNSGSSTAQTEKTSNSSASIKDKITKKLKIEPNKTEKAEQPKADTNKKTSQKINDTTPTINVVKTKRSTSATSTNKKDTKKSTDSKTKPKSRSPSPKFHISPLFLGSKSNTKNENEDQAVDNIAKKHTRSTRSNLTVPQLDGGNDIEKKKSLSSSLNASLKHVRSARKNSNSDDDFVVSPPKKIKSSSGNAVPANKAIDGVMKRDRRVLSTDCEQSTSEPTKTKKIPVNIWVEVFSEVEEKWVTIDLFKNKVHCVDYLRHAATTPILYVFAWNNDGSLKDVSARYCPQWNTVTRKMRVEKEWLDEAIKRHIGKKNVRDKAEDRELEKIHIDKPLPTTISEYKNHPLYALERHLLKFEGIYPPNALTLGFVRGEPVYSRDCVHTLHSREIWLKSARVVKPKQQPYKIVKARPKWDKVNREVIKDLPLEIFGYWQTMEYDPPTAENGIVPRNAYGNVELFKECMLPKKTVHLQLPGLNRVCKKLRIDCAPAVIGFDFHQGSCHPLLDGFVVCEEYKDQVIAAWHVDKEEAEKRIEEKFEQRVYGNWKKLIKGLLIRQRLKIKYNFDSVCESSTTTTTTTSKKGKKT